MASRDARSADTASQPTAERRPPAPIAELAHEQPRAMSSDAVAGLLDPVDEPEHQQDGDRVVEARLALERARQPRRSVEPRSSAKIAAPSVAATIEPSSSPSSVEKSSSQPRPGR